MTDAESVRSLIEETVADFGRIDYLLKNAGRTGARTFFIDFSAKHFLQPPDQHIADMIRGGGRRNEPAPTGIARLNRHGRKCDSPSP